MVLLVTTDAGKTTPSSLPAPHVTRSTGHNNMFFELPEVATLVVFSVQSAPPPSAALKSIACAPRVVSVPVIAGPDPGPLSAAVLRSIAPIFSLMTASDLAPLGDVVTTCSRCNRRNGTASRLTAFMEMSAVVRSTRVGRYNAASAVVAVRIDLSQFVLDAIQRVSWCGTGCSISLVIASGLHAARVLATTAVLPPDAPAAPTIFDIEGAAFMSSAWPAITKAQSGTVNISGT
jgi:hypothetical protein